MDGQKHDIIDRHSKKRAILIDDALLLNQITQDYMHEIIDINEISDYYDTIILTKDKKYIDSYLEHWGLQAITSKKYDDYEELKREYRFLLLFCTKSEYRKLKEYYKCECLVR